MSSSLTPRCGAGRRRRRPAARFRVVAPDSIVAKIQSGYVRVHVERRYRRPASAGSTDVPPGEDPDGIVTCVRWESAMLRRDFRDSRDAPSGSPDDGIFLSQWRTAAEEFPRRDDRRGARPSGGRGGEFRQRGSRSLRAQRRKQPAPPIATPISACSTLSWGKRDEAIREGRLAVELKPLGERRDRRSDHAMLSGPDLCAGRGK